MAAGLDTLHDTIEGLAALDPTLLDDHELHNAVIALQREQARLGVVAARLLNQWAGRRVWAGDGSRSATARLARDTTSAPATAAVELRRARHLGALPATASAIWAGQLSLDHLDLLGRAAQAHRAACLRRDEQLLVEQCAPLRWAQATRLVQYWCHRADAQTDTDHTDQTDPGAPADDVHLHASTTIGGTVVLDGVLDPIGGAAVVSELNRLEHDLYLADQRDGITRTVAQRRAAALVVMAQRSATAPTDGRAPKPLFSVLLGDHAFTELCELANGTVITPHHLTPWLGTAQLETILFDGPTTIISVSKRRSFVGALRRAIEVRDRHCQHPSGCDIPAERCDIDHIVPHTHDGPTSQFNGRLECPTHNRHVDRHDHHTTPPPTRPVTRLDQLRAHLRWRYLHDDDHQGRPPPTAEGVRPQASR